MINASLNCAVSLALGRMLWGRPMTYEARGNEIYCLTSADEAELFLTVHPTTDCMMTPDEQAVVLANILNKL